MRQGFIALVLFAVIWSPQSLPGATDGELDLVTDRPDFTESAETVPAGRIQLEGGYTFSRSGEEESHALGEILLRIGAGRLWEVRLGVNSFNWTSGPGSDPSGLEDASLGVKIRLAEGGPLGSPRPETALLVGASAPTGADAVGESKWQPEATLALAWDLTDALALGSNISYARASDDGRRFDQLSWSLSLAIALGERTGTYVEYFGVSKESPEGPETHFLNGGVTYLLRPNLQLDLRGGFGLNSADPDYFVGFGAAARW